MKIAYGYDVKEDLSDPYVALANDALDKFSKSTMLGEFPVDFLPIRRPGFALFWACILTRSSVKFIPSWFPGVQFKKLGREWRILIDQLFDKPFEMVKEQMVGVIFPLCRLHSSNCGWNTRETVPRLLHSPIPT